MDTLSSGSTILSAMITPAVLISASGTMILSTSTRLGRVVDRVRDLSDRFEQISRADADGEMLDEKREMIFDQLRRLTRRARLLQQALTTFYVAVGIFVATSAAIGIVALSAMRYAWLPVSLGVSGACFLLYGSVLLILEARMALAATYKEMDFLWRMGKQMAPSDLVERHGSKRFRFLSGRDRS